MAWTSPKTSIKQNGYQNVKNDTSFLGLSHRDDDRFMVFLWVETLFSDVFLASSDPYFIVRFKMASILHTYNKNHDVILNIRHITAC